MEFFVNQESHLIPTRMVNAHCFCPRMAWFEEKEGVFSDNEHTIQGKFVHRNVDKPGGTLEHDSAEAPWHSRALWLSDASLGVSGKLDLVDVTEDGTVFPVDTKKGRSADGAIWETDRVQLALQALLLERSGFRVTKIAAWYHAERRRVEEVLTVELRDRAMKEVEATRVTLDHELPPPPLVGSTKCFGCSLNELCLPDEIRRLQTLEELSENSGRDCSPSQDKSCDTDGAPLRRIQPPRFDTIPLYVDSAAVLVRLKGGEVRVEDREGKLIRAVGVETVSHVNVYGNANVTTPLIRELLDRGIPLCFFSAGGWYRGRTMPAMSRQVHVREQQYSAANDSRRLAIAQRLIEDKIHNCRVLLRRNLSKEDETNALPSLKHAGKAASNVESSESLLGIEGNAARVYWGAFSALVSRTESSFEMSGRTRRPPRDRTNAILSYLYGMLTKDVSLALEMAGFDPFQGFFHTNHHGRPSLALDMMEPFRPIIADSVALTVIRKREVAPDDFIVAGQQVSMKPGARKASCARMNGGWTSSSFTPSSGIR